MVLKFEDARKKALPDSRKMTALEAAVDEALVDGLMAGERPVLIAADLIPWGIAGETILAHYRDAGWTVSHHSDQRDGDYYAFRPKKPRSGSHYRYGDDQYR